jgi:hypothetical protein
MGVAKHVQPAMMILWTNDSLIKRELSMAHGLACREGRERGAIELAAPEASRGWGILVGGWALALLRWN